MSSPTYVDSRCIVGPDLSLITHLNTIWKEDPAYHYELITVIPSAVSPLAFTCIWKKQYRPRTISEGITRYAEPVDLPPVSEFPEKGNVIRTLYPDGIHIGPLRKVTPEQYHGLPE